MSYKLLLSKIEEIVKAFLLYYEDFYYLLKKVFMLMLSLVYHLKGF